MWFVCSVHTVSRLKRLLLGLCCYTNQRDSCEIFLCTENTRIAMNITQISYSSSSSWSKQHWSFTWIMLVLVPIWFRAINQNQNLSQSQPLSKISDSQVRLNQKYATSKASQTRPAQVFRRTTISYMVTLFVRLILWEERRSSGGTLDQIPRIRLFNTPIWENVPLPCSFRHRILFSLTLIIVKSIIW